MAEAVIEESESLGQGARQFLEDVRLSFPQVLRGVKTKQVTHAILVHLTEYVKSLENAGLLESKETHQLHNAVQVLISTILYNTLACVWIFLPESVISLYFQLPTLKNLHLLYSGLSLSFENSLQFCKLLSENGKTCNRVI